MCCFKVENVVAPCIAGRLLQLPCSICKEYYSAAGVENDSIVDITVAGAERLVDKYCIAGGVERILAKIMQHCNNVAKCAANIL